METKILQGDRTEIDMATLAKLEKRKILKKEIYRYRELYFLAIFGITFFAVFSYAPMYGIQLAFKKYNIAKGITKSSWIGLENFRILFGRAEFWNVVKNTLVISILKTTITFPVPILLAIFLNEIRSRTLSRSLQVVFTLPHFLSWVTIGGIMKHLMASSGAINGMIQYFGGQPIGFLNNGNVFRGLLVFTEIWKESGWSCIIYMAAIAGIDPTYYESATIDGANRFQKAWSITIPCIRSTAAILLIMAVGGVMNANFDQVFNLYNPTVMSVADIIDTYIYRITFQQAPNYGLSTALGLFKGIINCVLLLGADAIVGKLDSNSRLL